MVDGDGHAIYAGTGGSFLHENTGRLSVPKKPTERLYIIISLSALFVLFLNLVSLLNQAAYFALIDNGVVVPFRV